MNINLNLEIQANRISTLPQGKLLGGSTVSLRLPFTPTRYYRHGWQSWSHSSWVDPSEPPIRIGDALKRLKNEDVKYAMDEHHGGSSLGAAEAPDGTIVLLGGLGMEARVELDGQSLRGFYEHGSGDWFLGVGTENQVFNHYVELLGKKLGRRRTEKAPRVWCSWYSLFFFINEVVIDKVINDFQGFPFDVIQIDDGWQATIGDWEANRKFPSGMAALAERIHKTGREAGIWLAPLLVRTNSSIFREHPEWLLKDEHGCPVVADINWGGICHVLDSTHPEVQDWLAKLIKKVRAWGYDYLKLDFLYAGGLVGNRYEELPRESAYREGLRIMREAADDAFILTCGAPIIPSIGLCDGIRIGPDVAPYWINRAYSQGNAFPTAAGTQNALRSSLHRLWLKRLVHIDPDVVFFRSKRIQLNKSQRDLLHALAWVTGYKATSDLPQWLNPTTREELIAFLEHEPEVEQLGRYRFRLDDHEVDFEPSLAVEKFKTNYPRWLAMNLGFGKDALQLGLPAIFESQKARLLRKKK